MQSLTLINGSATRTLASSDRGFSYGQGVFTTIRVIAGQPCLWQRHMHRLEQGTRTLGFPVSGIEKLIRRDIGLLPKSDLILKITLTAGIGPRGYATPDELHPTRVVAMDPLPAGLLEPPGPGRLTWCQTPLAIQPRLAGIKHLNRLEQVLARSEWRSPEITDGIMLDTDGYLVEGTFSNLFWVVNGRLLTPDLSHCGIRGVMRDAVIEQALKLGIEVGEVRARPEVLSAASELFITNSLIGIRPIEALPGQLFDTGAAPVTAALREALSGAGHV